MIGRVCSLIKMLEPERNRGLLWASGATVPVDGTDGYQTGCIFLHTDGGAATAAYINEGSVTSCNFNAVAGAAVVTKTIAIPLSDLRCEDAGQTLLPATPDGDGGTIGLGAAAGSPLTGTSTNNTAATESCMFDFVVPENYAAGNDLTVRVKSYLSAAANAESLVDVVAKLVKGGALDATDLCGTAGIDLKAVVAEQNNDFTIDSDAVGDVLAPGSIINIAIAFERDDTGGSTAGTVLCNGIDVLVNSQLFRTLPCPAASLTSDS
jgi:hypothetical protein